MAVLFQTDQFKEAIRLFLLSKQPTPNYLDTQEIS